MTEAVGQVASHPPALLVTTILGFGVFVSGTVVGNIARWKAVDVLAADDAAKDGEMFSSSRKISPSSGWTLLDLVFKTYRATRPDGPLSRMFRLGWVLNGFGILIALAGFIVWFSQQTA